MNGLPIIFLVILLIIFFVIYGIIYKNRKNSLPPRYSRNRLESDEFKLCVKLLRQNDIVVGKSQQRDRVCYWNKYKIDFAICECNGIVNLIIFREYNPGSHSMDLILLELKQLLFPIPTLVIKCNLMNDSV